MNLKIVTPEKVVLRDEADSITLPTMEGEITILPNHIPLIAVLVPGEIQVRMGKNVKFMAVSGGFIEVLSTKVVVLADTAERSEEIDIRRAEEAIKRAQELKEKRMVDAREFAMLSAKIEKEFARIRVGRRRRTSIEQQAAEIGKYQDEKMKKKE
ncbi:ATP synthase F1 subunit epsilon [Patescibacteria group bacterium]|nr:ATP synthase F1 subunit epsilon [Patescibacteria group bacterium]